MSSIGNGFIANTVPYDGRCAPNTYSQPCYSASNARTEQASPIGHYPSRDYSGSLVLPRSTEFMNSNYSDGRVNLHAACGALPVMHAPEAQAAMSGSFANSNYSDGRVNSYAACGAPGAQAAMNSSFANGNYSQGRGNSHAACGAPGAQASINIPFANSNYSQGRLNSHSACGAVQVIQQSPPEAPAAMCCPFTNSNHSQGRVNSNVACGGMQNNAPEAQAAMSYPRGSHQMRYTNEGDMVWEPYAREDRRADRFESDKKHSYVEAGQANSPDAFYDAHGNNPQDMSFITTLMIKNIPCKLTVQRLEEDICQVGFFGTYDFIHIPTRKNRSNLSYAFVNFVSVQEARRFSEVFEGHTFAGINSTKRCHVCPADVQGIEANRAHMSNGRFAW